MTFLLYLKLKLASRHQRFALAAGGESHPTKRTIFIIADKAVLAEPYHPSVCKVLDEYPLRVVTKMKQVGRPLRYAAGWYGGWYPVKQLDASPGMPTGARASG